MPNTNCPKTSGRIHTAVEMAEREGLSVPYANKILHTLKNKGLIASVRGINGGFRLIRGKHEMTIGHILESLDETLFPPKFCTWYAGQRDSCVHYKGPCTLRPLWTVLSNHISKILHGVSLADIVGKSEPVLTRAIQKKIGSLRGRSLGNQINTNLG